MKTLIFLGFLCIFKTIGYTQCNLSQRTNNISVIENNCDGHSVNGIVTNSITLNESCGDYRFTSPIISIVHPNTIIKTDSSKGILSISPNPFTQYITIDVSSQLQDYTLSIYSMLGQLVLGKRAYLSNNIYSINLEFLEPGSYFVFIQTSNKIDQIQKIIKI